MERNEITQDWDEKQVECNVCKAETVVLVDPNRWHDYIENKRMAQHVWPEATPAYREQIIGIRSGYHVCDNCWSSIGEDYDDE